MKIRLYYGHDCDSVNGFNNGYYLHSDYIEVADTDEAFSKCENALKEIWGGWEGESPLEEWENGYQLITGFYDCDGNDLTEEEFQERDCEEDSYTYIYVTFEEEL